MLHVDQGGWGVQARLLVKAGMLGFEEQLVLNGYTNTHKTHSALFECSMLPTSTSYSAGKCELLQ